VPPTSGINIITTIRRGGAAWTRLVSPHRQADFNIDGAVCLRDLYTSTSTADGTVRASIDGDKRNGNLRGKPAVIVHGARHAGAREPHLAPVLRAQQDGRHDEPLAYYEVTNAPALRRVHRQRRRARVRTARCRCTVLHPGDGHRVNNLTQRHGDPASQVVRTTPRGGTPGAAPAITAANVPPIAATPRGGRRDHVREQHADDSGLRRGQVKRQA
jgi:hydroxybutyrate-dimer hydrolase